MDTANATIAMVEVVGLNVGCHATIAQGFENTELTSEKLEHL